VNAARIAALATFALLGLVPAASAPVLDRARSGPCVEDPAVMRRTHMDLLRHGRDDTVHHGVRDRKQAFAGCVDCHASRSDGKVIGSERHFCQGCHAYAAVKLDCFECHSPNAREAAKIAGVAP
jgi:hypothetical protein